MCGRLCRRCQPRRVQTPPLNPKPLTLHPATWRLSSMRRTAATLLPLRVCPQRSMSTLSAGFCGTSATTACPPSARRLRMGLHSHLRLRQHTAGRSGNRLMGYGSCCRCLVRLYMFFSVCASWRLPAALFGPFSSQPQQNTSHAAIGAVVRGGDEPKSSRPSAGNDQSLLSHSPTGKAAAPPPRAVLFPHSTCRSTDPTHSALLGLRSGRASCSCGRGCRGLRTPELISLGTPLRRSPCSSVDINGMTGSWTASYWQYYLSDRHAHTQRDKEDGHLRVRDPS